MQTLSATYKATYKGNRVIELGEDIPLPKNKEVLVVIPKQDDERILHSQLQGVAEISFAKLWDNKEDDIWNEYL